MTGVRPALVIVPAVLREPAQLDVLARCLVSVWGTRSGADVLVAADGGADEALLAPLEAACGELGQELLRLPEGSGHAALVNAGLRRALEEGRDAVLLAPDVVVSLDGWLARLQERTGSDGAPAAVVGARLLYPEGLIEHAGMLYSLLERDWYPRLHFGPRDLPEAQRPFRCPVGGGLQLIRHEWLERTGLYDEAFATGRGDVDFCLRAFAAGGQCVYEPTVWAVRHRKMRHAKALAAEPEARAARAALAVKWPAADLGRWVQEAV